MKKYFEAIEGGGGFDYQKEYYKLSTLLKEKEDEIEFLNKNSDELMESLSKYKALAEAADAAIYAIDGISESNLNDKIRIYNELKLKP